MTDHLHPLHPELIWAFTLDEQKIGPIHQALDIRVDTYLNGEEKLYFYMLPDDPKLDWIQIDGYVEYDGLAWRVSEETKVRDNAEYVVEWVALPLWYDLVDEVKFGDFILTNETMSDGLAEILADSNWTPAFMSDPGTLYSMEATNGTVLELIRSWAAITGYEIRWNTPTREVGFVDQLGSEQQYGFQFGRNLDNVKRTYLPPQATRLYPIGANDIGITWVNGGIPYVENFSWYTDQGLTVDQARELYLKEAIWQDENYITRLSLLDAAVEYLARISQPTISYECSVLDLSELTSGGDNFSIGDVVWVRDDPLDIDIRTRIVRLTHYPYQHWKGEVELSYLKPGFTTNLVNSFASGRSSEWRLLVDETPGNSVAGSNVVVASITFTTSGNSSGIIGGHIVGTASGSGKLETTITIDSNVLGVPTNTDFTNGQTVEIGIPSWFTDLDEGTHTLQLRARISTGAGNITIPEFGGRLYIMANNTLGGGAGGSITNLVVADTLWGDVFTPTDSTPTVLYMTDETATGSDTLADTTVDPSDSAPTIEFG